MEQAYRSALRAYEFLGRPEALGILHSPGYHGANDVQASMDWLDKQFGLSDTLWPNEFIYPWDYEHWADQAGEDIDIAAFPVREAGELLVDSNGGAITTIEQWELRREGILESVEWLLGDSVAGALPRPFPLPRLGDTAQPAAPPRAGRGGEDATSVTLFDDIHGSKATSMSYGWVQSVVDDTMKRKIIVPGSTAFAGRFEMSVWYAPDVNRTVRQEHRVWTADGISPVLAAEEILELVAYRPPS
jgi:hypothetical protein